MSAEKIIFELLSAHAPLTALVPADRISVANWHEYFFGGGWTSRISPGPLPQGSSLPAIATNLISSRARHTVSTAEAKRLWISRMQCTALAASYAEQKRLIRLIDDACRYKRGTVAGFTGVSVLPELEGPDMRDDDATIYMQTIDFMVAYQAT